MLVLTRKTGDSIVLTTASGDRIEIKVTKIQNSRCAIAIDAPLHVKVMRAEVENTK